MAMSFEFISGSMNRKSIFDILKNSEKGRKILNSLSLPETKEELDEYERNRETLSALYQTLVDIDSQRKHNLQRALKK